MKASANTQIIALTVLSALCILGLIYMYSNNVTPPELFIGFSGAIVAALLSEVAQDNALNRAERVGKNMTIDVFEDEKPIKSD